MLSTIKEYQAKFDQEARDGKCFYCHEPVAGDTTALHLRNPRGVLTHVHGECDRNLKEELAFERWQEENEDVLD